MQTIMTIDQNVERDRKRKCQTLDLKTKYFFVVGAKTETLLRSINYVLCAQASLDFD